MLKCEQNTIEICDEVENLAKEYFDSYENIDTFFEHGQWWVSVIDEDGEERNYSVVDGIPGINGSGFYFEEI